MYHLRRVPFSTSGRPSARYCPEWHFVETIEGRTRHRAGLLCPRARGAEKRRVTQRILMAPWRGSNCTSCEEKTSLELGDAILGMQLLIARRPPDSAAPPICAGQNQTANQRAQSGWQAFKDGHPTEAKAWLEDAVHLDPSQPNYHVALSEIDLSLRDAPRRDSPFGNRIETRSAGRSGSVQTSATVSVVR